MSKFIFTCSYCQKQFYAQEAWLGESTNCPNCHSTIIITKETNTDSFSNRMPLGKFLLVLGIVVGIISELLGGVCMLALREQVLDRSITPLLHLCTFLFCVISYFGWTLVGISLGQKYQKIVSKVSATFIIIIAIILAVTNLLLGTFVIPFWFILIIIGIAVGKNIILKSIPKYSLSVIDQRGVGLAISCWLIVIVLLYFKTMQLIQLS